MRAFLEFPKFSEPHALFFSIKAPYLTRSIWCWQFLSIGAYPCGRGNSAARDA